MPSIKELIEDKPNITGTITNKIITVLNKKQKLWKNNYRDHFKK